MIDWAGAIQCLGLANRDGAFVASLDIERELGMSKPESPTQICKLPTVLAGRCHAEVCRVAEARPISAVFRRTEFSVAANSTYRRLDSP